MNSLDGLLLSYKEEMVKSLMELASIASVKGPAQENAPFGRENRRALDYVLNKAGEFGFSCVDVDGYAAHMEYGDGEKVLGVLTHLDVVPAGEGWDTEPFEPVIRDGLLYARGVTDNKNSCISALYALRAIKELGLPMKDRIRLIMGCDEETGSSDMEYYAKKIGMPDYGFSPDGSFPVVYAEKGVHRVLLDMPIMAGSPLIWLRSGTVVNVVPNKCEMCFAHNEGLHKDICDRVRELKLDADVRVENWQIHVVVRGVSAHASLPHLGKNAASLALKLLASLDLGEHTHSFQDLYSCLPEGGYDGSGIGAAFCDEPSGALTANLGLLEIQDGRAFATLDIRQPVTLTREAVIGAIEAAVSPLGILAVSQGYMGPLYLPVEHPLVQTLKGVYHRFTGDDSPALAIGGGTYARAMKNAVAFGPEGLKGERSGGMHEANEHLDLEEFFLCTRIFAHAMAELAEKGLGECG